MNAVNKDEPGPNGKTLHEHVAKVLAQRIREGEWPVGSALPSEASFCALYQVSRHTLRHALATLEENGLILRRQGAPTRVISRQQPRRFVQSLNSPGDILRYSAGTHRINERMEYVECDSHLAQVLKAPLGSSWFHIEALRKEKDSGQVISCVDVYMLPQFAGVAKESDFSDSMVYEKIEQRFGIAAHRAEVEIYATAASARISKSLHLPRGTSCLAIVRRYLDARGKTFEVTVNYHPENRFVYTMEYTTIGH
jgi:DNA-binding GntR family transcriptional regulator